jgi:hypothetical protein
MKFLRPGGWVPDLGALYSIAGNYISKTPIYFRHFNWSLKSGKIGLSVFFRIHSQIDYECFVVWFCIRKCSCHQSHAQHWGPCCKWDILYKQFGSSCAKSGSPSNDQKKFPPLFKLKTQPEHTIYSSVHNLSLSNLLWYAVNDRWSYWAESWYQKLLNQLHIIKQILLLKAFPIPFCLMPKSVCFASLYPRLFNEFPPPPPKKISRPSTQM